MTSTRLLTAAFAVPALYFYIMKLSPAFMTLLVILITLWSQYEFYAMYKVRPSFAWLGMVFGALVIATTHFQGNVAVAAMLGVLAIMSLRLFAIKRPEGSLLDVAPVITGLVYVPLLLSMFLPLRAAGPQWIIYMMASIWGADAFAYFIGKGMGKRKLYPSMSPNKTVAGAVGSFIGGASGALLVMWLLIPELSAINAVISGLVVGGVTIIGDLVESMFKRDAGVKDSGALIPGHGGMLDKVDGALFAGPALYWTLLALGVIPKV